MSIDDRFKSGFLYDSRNAICVRGNCDLPGRCILPPGDLQGFVNMLRPMLWKIDCSKLRMSSRLLDSMGSDLEMKIDESMSHRLDQRLKYRLWSQLFRAVKNRRSVSENPKWLNQLLGL